MKSINSQAQNKVSISGKLLDVSFSSGKTKKGVPYERANVTVRVVQTYGGKEEVSEISVPFFATQYTNSGAPNPAYRSIQQLKEMKTVAQYGADMADSISINRAELQENNFVSKSTGQLVSTHQFRASFFNTGAAKNVATFSIKDAFILDMRDEVDREGETTGRLIVKVGIVQYGGRLDVLEMIAENPAHVDFISRNWNINDTLYIEGFIRSTVVEEFRTKTSSWGEQIPESSTKTVHELIITNGDDCCVDEEIDYDPAESKKAFNARKARLEQLLQDAADAPKKSAAPALSKYDWQE